MRWKRKSQLGFGGVWLELCISESPQKEIKTPGWCDRILWRRGDPIALLDYDSRPELKISDHKPVIAFMAIKVRSFCRKILLSLTIGL